MMGETEMKRIKEGEIIQIQRKGFFRCDVPYSPINAHSSREQPLILFHVPDGHTTSPISQTTSNQSEKNTQPTKQTVIKFYLKHYFLVKIEKNSNFSY